MRREETRRGGGAKFVNPVFSWKTRGRVFPAGWAIESVEGDRVIYASAAAAAASDGPRIIGRVGECRRRRRRPISRRSLVNEQAAAASDVFVDGSARYFGVRF